ncbi:copper-translocating P-type ATPase [Dethiobacter alkaliphilus]|uniref:P-type Cu(+) transporter n=1 Tax=Dethiobacter alkaliphilus AHT 1 TaxID=555088 RepID=C0GJZ7_DETAL|nr:copper-translocating P-type ATPase [Dethiobacter alkaliphilus]EEG76366.1 copper-translocating P-type ATPase [Dethiobacter alkaliphilus AHT 1]
MNEKKHNGSSHSMETDHEKDNNHEEHKSGEHDNKSGSHDEHGDHDSGGHDKHSDHDSNGHDEHADHDSGGHGGHGSGHSETDHHRMMIKDFRRRFWFSLILSIPVLALSPMFQDWLRYTLEFPGDDWVFFIFASAIYFYGGWPFLTGLVDEVKKKQPGMMTLIGLATTVAYVYSTAVFFGFPGDVLYWEMVTLIDIMLLGHWMEMKSILSASQALEKLMELMPDTAHLVTEDGETKEVKISKLKDDDVVLVKPGEKIPADGEIVDGKSYVDESMITGESKPVERKKSDNVIGGSVNGEGSVKVKISGVGDDSYLSKVVNLVQDAQKTKSRSQRLADKAHFVLTVVALTGGTLTLIAWTLAGESVAFSIERAVAVMVIACPHALGLAIPLVVSISTSISANNGLLIRNRTQFEKARNISMVVFDKTGTLTEGKFGVTGINTEDDYDEKELIRLAAAVEKESEHPIATGIVEKAKSMDLDIPDVSEFNSFKGKGIEGMADGKNIKVVSPGYLREHDIDFQKETKEEATTTVYVLIDDKLAGAISLADKIRPQSYEAIKALHKMGIKCHMLTGDNNETAKKVSEELGLDGFEAEVLPDKKQTKVKELQEKGELVAMTGDGVNDAPALAQADIGIAIGSGTDVAAETADVILVDSNPQDVVTLIRFGKATYRKMVQNLFWASAYNIVALPLAAGVLYGAGIIISPSVGAVAMSLSTIIVAINAKLLRLDKNSDDGQPQSSSANQAASA